MFKRFKHWLQGIVQPKSSAPVKTKEKDNMPTNINSSSTSEQDIASKELCKNLWEYILQSDNLDKLFKNYLSKHSTSELLEELTLIFNSNNTRCAFVRMHRENLCRSLLRCKVEHIYSWLSILSIDTTKDLYYGDFSIEFLDEHIPEEILKPFVVENFKSILERTETDMFHYFSKYYEWKELFIKNLPSVLKGTHYENIQDALELIELFPEYELTIYETILTCYIDCKIKKTNSLKVWDSFSISKNVLIPIADLEKSGQISSVVIPSIVPELLTVLPSFSEIYEVQEILITDFGISDALVNTIVENRIRNYIDTLMYNKQKIDKLINILNELLKNKYAFDYFFENLYEIMHRQGLDLYYYLIKQFGNVKFITCTKFSCFDYI